MSTIVPERFAGATVIVTGAGSGIGRATAERLLAEGASVIGSDLAAERLDELVSEVGNESLTTVAGDVGEQDHVDELVSLAGDRLTGLVNNAGIMDGFLPTAEITDEIWDAVMRVNVTATMRLMRAALPGFVERGHGRIVNISSGAGVRAGTSGTAYSASKHAVIGLTKSTALFYGHQGIRCNTVAPGSVKTNIGSTSRPLSQWAREHLDASLKTSPPQASPEAVAASVCWLLSEDSANVNGAVVFSDGGWSTV